MSHTENMVEVVVTDEFRAWYEALTIEEQQSVQRLVAMLEMDGVARGSRPGCRAALGTVPA